MNYSQAISGVSACYYERKDYRNQRSLTTDLHINKILEIVNENERNKLYSVTDVVRAIEQLKRERAMTEEQAAKYVRDAAEWWSKRRSRANV